MKAEGRIQKSEVRKGQIEGGERPRTRSHGLGFWLAVGLALMVGMAAPSYGGRSHGLIAARVSGTITMRVYNYADVPMRVLKQAEKEASYVFNQAGVKVIWSDCLANSSALGCSEPITFFNLSLRVLPGEPRLEAGLHEDSLGFEFATIANVYSSKVKALAESIEEDQEYGTLLGDAMAHELGHLLLGSGHTPAGIMQATWGKETLRLGINRMLHFTPEQGLALRIRAPEFEEARRKVAHANALR